MASQTREPSPSTSTLMFCCCLDAPSWDRRCMIHEDLVAGGEV